jgi:4-hydroxyacetophenone monooxygenase
MCVFSATTTQTHREVPVLKDPTPDPTVDRQEIEEAVQRANLPTLVMVLFQLTGDQKWLEEPYRPTAGRGLTPHDGGGFDQQTAAAIRQAAAEEILRWHHGAPPAIPNPPGDLLLALLSQAVGEAVPPEYGRLMAVEMGFEAPDAPSSLQRRPAAAASTRDPNKPTVVIIGAGISGMAAAVRLQQLNVDYVILERNNDVGGVWLTNIYPGAGVDTPSFLYSFSFYTRKWSTHFAKQAEMIEYLHDTADHFDLRRDIKFNTTVSAVRWDDDADLWRITAHGPEGEVQLEAPFLISAVGLFNKPSVPDIPGLDSFAGALAHTAKWPDDLDLADKKVAVIGTGASAMQVVPAVADRVQQLTIFQRSPQWAAPNGEYFAKVSDGVHFLMEHVPYYHQWYRFRLAWIFNDRVHPSLQIDPEWPDPDHSLNVVNDGHRRYFTRYIDGQLGDRVDLRDKVLPTYPPFGKRMLLDNGWFAALKKNNVRLVTERVESVDASGINTADRHWDADTIVLGTGFDVRQYLPDLPVFGRDGRSLHEYWGREDAVGHLGMTVPGFPNFFMMYGPNTNGGAGGSYIFIGECQVTYITKLIVRALDEQISAIEPRPEALECWVSDVDEAHRRMVWSHPGMTTYYRNSHGRVTVNSPWRVIDYWGMTREPSLDDFVLHPTREEVRA